MARMSNKLIPLLCFLLFTYLQSNSLQAQEAITISVGEWPPYISQNQKHNGVVSHLIRDIFSDMDIDVSFEFLPWSRAYSETKQGRFEATAIWMDKAERKVDFIYSDSVLIEQFVFSTTKALCSIGRPWMI